MTPTVHTSDSCPSRLDVWQCLVVQHPWITKFNITGNVHIEYRRGRSTCGVSPAKAHCAAAMLPAVALPRERYLFDRYLPCSSLSLWVKCSHLWQCRRGVTARIDSLKGQFHHEWNRGPNSFLWYSLLKSKFQPVPTFSYRTAND